ncbi:unnamed protein product [Musa acuminata var. zebrina]
MAFCFIKRSMLKSLLLHLEVASCFQNSSNACILRWLTNASSLAHIGNLQSLQVLHLSRNSITGQLPETIGKLDLLQFLDISDQPLIRADAEVFRLDLSSNSLEGDITEANFSQLLQLGNFGHILQLLQIGFPFDASFIDMTGKVSVI